MKKNTSHSSNYAMKLKYRKSLAGSVGGQAFFISAHTGKKMPKPLPFFVDA